MDPLHRREGRNTTPDTVTWPAQRSQTFFGEKQTDEQIALQKMAQHA